MSLTLQAQLVADAQTQTITASAAYTAGDIIQLDDGRAAVVIRDMASGDSDEVYVAGHFEVAHVAAASDAGCLIGWDEDGDPYNGTSGDGCATPQLGDADFILGAATEDSTATSEKIRLDLNVIPPEMASVMTNKTFENVSANKTLDAQDVGKVMVVTADDKTITLPATAAGLEFVVYNGGSNASVGLTVSPNASDKLMGADVAGADNKDYLNAKANAYTGDFIRIVGDGSAGWYVLEERGTWTQES